MSTPDRPQFGIPFRGTLYDVSGYRSLKDVGMVKTFEHNPNILVRVIEPRWTLDQDIRELPKILNVLQDSYGINVVRHNIVIGPSTSPNSKQTYYVVTEGIEGKELGGDTYSPFKPEEAASAAPQADEFFAGIAQYMWDVYLEGGIFTDSLVSRSQKVVYGHRMGEEGNKVWLTDVGRMETVNSLPRNRDVILLMENFSDRISLAEHRLKIRLGKARGKVLDFLRSITPDDKQTYEATLKVRQYVGDPLAQDAISALFDEEKRLKVELDNELATNYSQIIAELDITPDEYKTLVVDFFEKSKKELEAGLKGMGQPVLVGRGYPIPDPKAYIDYEHDLFGGFINDYLFEKTAQAIGEDKMQALYQKYDYRMVNEAIRELINQRQAGIGIKTLDPKDYTTVEREAFKQLIPDVWGYDLLAHLEDISFLVKNDTEMADYYLPLIEKQLGWGYHFSYTTDEVKAMFEQTDLDKNNDDDFVNFVVPLVSDDIEKELNSKLEEIEARYGEDITYLLEEVFNNRDVNRILEEARK